MADRLSLVPRLRRGATMHVIDDDVLVLVLEGAELSRLTGTLAEDAIAAETQAALLRLFRGWRAAGAGE